MGAISGLDHAIIAVAGLTEGAAAMRRLGFLTTPLAAHSDHKGTENTTIVFRDRTYVELMGVRLERPANARLRAALAEGRALFGAALATDDAAVTAAAWRDAGVSDGDGFSEFSRPVDLPGGPKEAAFRTCGVSEAASGGPLVFACEHRTPELVWRPEFLDHPNAVVGVSRVVGVAQDLDAAAETWGHIAPDARQERRDDALTVALGNVELEVLRPGFYAAVYGHPPVGDPGFGALVFRTADLAKTRRTLEGVGFRETEAGLSVAPEDGLGVVLVFAP